MDSLDPNRCSNGPPPAHLCCPICCLRLPRSAVMSTCPDCERPLEPTSARAALGYRLFEIVDPLPLSPTATAAAVALSALLPGERHDR